MKSLPQSKVRPLRLKLGVGQEEFCKLSDMSIFRLFRIETDRSDIRGKEIMGIIRAFNLKVDYFFNSNNSDNNSISGS